MATAPHHNWIDEAEEDQEFHDLPVPPSYPGSTVDALLEQGRTLEAREELERLVEIGIKSGNPRQMDQSLFEEIIAKARARAAQPTR